MDSTQMDFEARKVQIDTGMDFLQALHQVQGRALAKLATERERRAAIDRAVARFADNERSQALRRMLAELLDLLAPVYDVIRPDDGELVCTHPTLTAARTLLAKLDAEDAEDRRAAA